MWFLFVIVRWVSCSGDTEDLFDLNSCEVQVEYHGIARYDGMRHMYQGMEETDNEGYLYYPSMKDHIKYFEKLLELTRRFCPSFGDDFEYWNRGDNR